MRNLENGEFITRESILKLIEEKDRIEAQLRELKQVLDGNNIGMAEPLVDNEGYPRQDIDVYQVRQARHKIICLQNDYKSLMGKIEKGIHFLHSQSVESQGNTSHLETVFNPDTESSPFAKIIQVDFDSPAYSAGLVVGDLILSFGSIKYENFRSMQDIASVVQHSISQNVPVIVKRGPHVKHLMLKPQEWKGKGLLGCVIVGLENVDK